MEWASSSIVPSIAAGKMKIKITINYNIKDFLALKIKLKYEKNEMTVP